MRRRSDECQRCNDMKKCRMDNDHDVTHTDMEWMKRGKGKEHYIHPTSTKSPQQETHVRKTRPIILFDHTPCTFTVFFEATIVFS
jgi:hypothetical protein